ncbi:MAG: hypothetical protein ABI432_04210 [Flavobacteriales bacterium]
MSKLLDGYYKRPLLWDLLLAALACVLIQWVVRPRCGFLTFPQCDTVLDLLSDLSSTSISLAGFVLAALTIVVTFRDNMHHKEATLDEEKKQELSALELLFLTKHYYGIVKVFSWSTLILVAIYIIAAVLKLAHGEFGDVPLFYGAVYLMIVLSLTILRCLYVLFRIVRLQSAGKSA